MSRDNNRKTAGDRRKDGTLGHSERKTAQSEDKYTRKSEVLSEEELSGRIEGRNAVIEAYRSGRTIDKLFVLEDNHDGPVSTILREAKKAGTYVNFVSKERLNEMSLTGHHQGVIAQAAAFAYAETEDRKTS